MSTQMTNGFTSAVAVTEITRRLTAGERVLVVGARLSNLPQSLQEHPQVELWTDLPRVTPPVPANVRIVLFTKWVGHSQHKAIREDAARDQSRFVWPKLLGTGELRRLLAPLPVVVIPEPAPAPVEQVEPLETPCDCGYVPHCGIAWGESTREFVEVHWHPDEDHTTGWQTREAKRLHRLAAQHGLSTTVNYLGVLVSQLNTARGARQRDEARLSQERAERAEAILALEHAEEKALAEAAAASRAKAYGVEQREQAKSKSTEAVTAGEQRVDAELTELLRMIDDASAVLALARETIVQLSRDAAEQRAVRERLRARVKAALEEAI